MTLDVPLNLRSMKAIAVDRVPGGSRLFEPKRDGFRCLLFRDGDIAHLQSRRQRPLGRYFPEIIDAAGRLPLTRFVFDGEFDYRRSTVLLEPLTGRGGFTGNMPGGKGRRTGRERKPVPLEPRLVADVSADHIENGRFRHGSRLIRWRDDKEPKACTMDQIEPVAGHDD
jgi:ATP-dependent DNA ligase